MPLAYRAFPKRQLAGFPSSSLATNPTALDGTAHMQKKCQLSTVAIHSLPPTLNPL